MKQVKDIKTELGEAVIKFPDGTKRKVNTKTVYTYYKDGSNDCNVILDKPIDFSGKINKEDK